MNKIVTVFLSLIFIGCTPQREVFTLFETPENTSGQCYWFEEMIPPKNDSFEDFKEQYKLWSIPKSFVLEIIPGDFKIEKVNFNDPILQTKAIDSSRYRVTTYVSKIYSFDHKTSDCYLKYFKRSGHRICHGEKAVEMKVISKYQLEKLNYQIEIKKQISEPRIVKIYKKEKPDSLNSNQRFVHKGLYTRMLNVSHICDEGPKWDKDITIVLLEFLSNQGYKVGNASKLDNIHSEFLKDYQLKNGLTKELGKLDHETILHIEQINFITKLKKIGYIIENTASWSDEANAALVDFQLKNNITENIGIYGYRTKSQMKKVEYIPLLIELGYKIDNNNSWGKQANEALIQYQIDHNLLTYIGSLDYYTMEHIKKGVLRKNKSR